VASRLPRTVTIRDGRIGAEGRAGHQFAVVAADGSLALPAAVLQQLPPGTLVSVDLDGTDRWTLTREDPEGTT
jgi:putative ABC transport system ATP-binding protein